MEKPATTLPWAASDSRSELIFRDGQGVIDLSRPVAMFQHAQDARFVLNAIDALTTVAQQIDDLKKAFGAPGDYGYGTASGDALYAIYTTGASIQHALGRLAEVRS